MRKLVRGNVPRWLIMHGQGSLSTSGSRCNYEPPRIMVLAPESKTVSGNPHKPSLLALQYTTGVSCRRPLHKGLGQRGPYTRVSGIGRA
jgi:hypothetical protein